MIRQNIGSTLRRSSKRSAKVSTSIRAFVEFSMEDVGSSIPVSFEKIVWQIAELYGDQGFEKRRRYMTLKSSWSLK